MQWNAVLLVAIFVGSLGCGIGDAVSDNCRMERRAYESSQRKQAGLTTRGVPRDADIQKLAREELGHTRGNLLSCERRPANPGSSAKAASA